MNDFNTELIGATNPKNALKEEGAKDQREALWMVPFEKLVILPDFNVREHDEAWKARVRTLADDMKEVGFMRSKPIEVFVDSEGRIVVTDGHTRHAAVSLARSEDATNLDSIPSMPREKGTSMEDLTIGLVKSNSGEKLSPLGLSIVVKRLVINFKKTPAEAAKLLGMSPKYAKQMLTLAGAPEEIRQMIMAGLVSATHAIELLEEYGGEALKILQQGLSDAEEKGKTVVRKKNTLTPEAKLDKAQKKHAAALYQLVDLLLEPDVTPEREKEIKDKLENVMLAIEQEAEVSA